MPCETFTSTGASPAFDTTTQELGVTVAPPAAQEAALHILRRRSLAAPVRPAPVLDTRFVASEPARPTVLH